VMAWTGTAVGAIPDCRVLRILIVRSACARDSTLVDRRYNSNQALLFSEGFFRVAASVCPAPAAQRPVPSQRGEATHGFQQA
jgi:hypothetical protein